jgi:hypothetical protein
VGVFWLRMNQGSTCSESRDCMSLGKGHSREGADQAGEHNQRGGCYNPEAVCPLARPAPFVKPSLVLGVAADPGAS